MGGAQNSPRVEEKSWIKASRDQPPGFFCARRWFILMTGGGELEEVVS